MSEAILKALMHLFAIIAKQDDGITEEKRDYVKRFLRQQLAEDQVAEYYAQFEEFLIEKKKKKKRELAMAGDDGAAEKEEKKLTSTTDSIRILKICRGINKTLTQPQKVITLVRLFELLKADGNFSEQRIAILATASSVYKIDKPEYAAIEAFAIKDSLVELTGDYLAYTDKYEDGEKVKHLPGAMGTMVIQKVPSVNLYFLRYHGQTKVELNGFPVVSDRIYLFAPGSVIKPPKGKPIYYSDVVAHFMSDQEIARLSFEVKDLQFKFANGKLGLRNISLSETEGKLVGIMGASGAGKTTLLNTLSGIETPSSGHVKINGIDVHHQADQVEGVVGYVPQDDLLIEELTVYENLYYNALLCFRNMPKAELEELVETTLDNLGLLETRDLKVGSPLEKTVSGGQRKRLNIGLELIREPSVMYLDEPTSGLSSKDSENVLELLSELALKGKLIFVVIHQPSSTIYKMFDKMIFLDTGGYLIYYGNPIQAVSYFKKLDNQINAEVGECLECGTINPDIVFDIVEAKVVDEYGKLTKKRKVMPESWAKYYEEHREDVVVEQVNTAPPRSSEIPMWMQQFATYFKRDLASKLRNTQYMVINLLEAPLLAFILAFIIRYISDPNSDVYVFRDNENIPAFIFMSVIVLLFVGLTVSAEEIFRDRKILKREAFLNLSKSSYLLAKMGILFMLSGIQSLTFVVVGNLIVGIESMYVDYWLMLFSTACCANLIGLNISTAFKSAVTIYILIPLLIIPQMILGGAMFSFEKLNRAVGGGYSVPPIAEIMPARWAYEGLVVNQFMSNEYEKYFYDIDKKISRYNYQQGNFKSAMIFVAERAMRYVDGSAEISEDQFENDLAILNNGLQEYANDSLSNLFQHAGRLNSIDFDQQTGKALVEYLHETSSLYNIKMNLMYMDKELKIAKMERLLESKKAFRQFQDQHDNTYLTDVVKMQFAPKKYVYAGAAIHQVIDPIFVDAAPGKRAHFYAPTKTIFGSRVSTFSFNIVVLWVMTALLYTMLYMDVLNRLFNLIERLNLAKLVRKKNESI